ATTEKHKILPTILSRCQIFDFKRITTNDTVQHLEEICVKEEITAEKAALQIIAQKSEGCMRDALSILDKIVSFTNGELNYTNTLEHLNILDADYYFRILEYMQGQDLASAMLIYDDINRKGFEGDLVLNGLAEFMRNLLVCKDEKAAMLLEAVESFKSRYLETARKVNAGLLVSALNILNEAEINYKSARNKRLHVELTLIKLCYLQQALDLTTDAGSSGKKKITESALAFRTRPIRQMALKTPVVESAPPAPVTTPASGAKLIIETPAPRATEPAVTAYIPEKKVTEATKTGNKLSALDKIRKQYTGNGNNAHEKAIIALEMETLQQAWEEYIVRLKADRNPAAQPFSLALLRIRDANSFEAITANNIEQKFIEAERNALFHFLQQRLQNKLLQFTVTVEDKNDDRAPVEVTLTSKEQFMKMAEQYPVIWDLKERLKLELDY
ncbi:MAG TPA: DNA polymerase III subunit gamma/tau, partial [Chitinophagaceae bacterium]|nr:DNA polymerase III subunit gamma/tau [Chitinophagaceae bacterium]